MLNALASADAVTWLSIVVKALVYATAFLAMGSVLSIWALRRLPPSEVQALRRLSVLCAIGAALLSLARLPLRASFLMGGTWQGATDPMMLTMVSESPLGSSIALRLVGLALICAVMLPARLGRPLAAFGVITVAASFVFRGHTLEEPRLLLAALITLHILGLAFWIGAFAPLYRLSGANTARVAGQVSHDFGRIAVWVVGALTLAGGTTLWLLTGNVLTALFTAYGQFFAIKLGVFLAIIAFAAWNKLRLTPALLRQEQGAGARLRGSIRMETALVALILLTTAILTTVSAPEAVNQTARAAAEGQITKMNKGGFL
ncbi:copper resistance D family protein [Sedimentitalea todarodis]|uniref:CopD family protein n=1 Tax=Sedimentitalea todarodis TaxID=1631240 RepID=A0ABU3VJR4_9RHOB|nr:CopD family protein [Sedimentitalea todarodis]MDU9006432.1 CopD family protein [Sedimentitalea todarodis]